MKLQRSIYRIGYVNPYNDMKLAELETRKRMQYCVEQQGHIFIALDNLGYCFETNIHAENLQLDFILSHEPRINPEFPCPNVYTIFMHWAPCGFLPPSLRDAYFAYMNKFDDIVGGCESDLIKTSVSNLECSSSSFTSISSSVPMDFIIPPQCNFRKKLFYVGVNMEDKSSRNASRFSDLFKALDRKDLIDIYGPLKNDGSKSWEGYSCYKGEIPFDGRSIIKKINEAGICLALNSAVHNLNHTVSNRIFEAAAAGAVIISDDNPFVRKYFGDSVFYVDITKNEDELVDDVLCLIDYITANESIAYHMACDSQEIFLKYLTLDHYVKNIIDHCDLHKKELECKENESCVVVDVICFIENLEGLGSIVRQLCDQYYKNIHVWIFADKALCQQIKNVPFKHTIVENNSRFRGAAFGSIKEKLKGDLFLFCDGNSSFHKNHILKSVKKLHGHDEYFVYSGVYLLKMDSAKDCFVSYTPINHTPLLRKEFLGFSHITHHNLERLLSIEEKFALNSPLFNKKILKLISVQEMEQVTSALHFYLAVCSIVKASAMGRFTYNISAGYIISESQDYESIVFPTRNLYRHYGYSQNIYASELSEIFFKYNYETEVLDAPTPTEALDAPEPAEALDAPKPTEGLDTPKSTGILRTLGVTSIKRFLRRITMFFCI